MVLTAKSTSEGFETIYQNSAFKCAFISPSVQYRFGKVSLLKRHNDTDEVFVLLSGKAVLLTRDGDGPYERTPLQPNTAYNVTKGTWHHLAVSDDALVFVTESGSLLPQNTESIQIVEENIVV